MKKTKLIFLDIRDNLLSHEQMLILGKYLPKTKLKWFGLELMPSEKKMIHFFTDLNLHLTKIEILMIGDDCYEFKKFDILTREYGNSMTEKELLDRENISMHDIMNIRLHFPMNDIQIELDQFGQRHYNRITDVTFFNLYVFFLYTTLTNLIPPPKKINTKGLCRILFRHLGAG